MSPGQSVDQKSTLLALSEDEEADKPAQDREGGLAPVDTLREKWIWTWRIAILAINSVILILEIDGKVSYQKTS